MLWDGAALWRRKALLCCAQLSPLLAFPSPRILQGSSSSFHLSQAEQRD